VGCLGRCIGRDRCRCIRLFAVEHPRHIAGYDSLHDPIRAGAGQADRSDRQQRNARTGTGTGHSAGCPCPAV